MNARRKIVYSFLHGLGLSCFVLVWLYYGYFTTEDRLEFKYTQLIKRSLLRIDDKPKYSIVFIDVSGSKDLIPAEDDTAQRLVITDRHRLAEFIGRLETENIRYRYILCDVFFSGRSPQDKFLLPVLQQCPNIILAAEMDENNHPRKPLFNLHSGMVSYAAEEGDFIKLNLYANDSLASLPLVMFCDLHHPVIKTGAFLNIDGSLFLRKQTIDPRIRSYDLTTRSDFALYPLTDLLHLPAGSPALHEFLDNKILVIGNFKDDMAGTLLGATPTPLVMVNAYLALEYRDNRITFLWMTYLVSMFTLLSYAAFYYQKPLLRLEASIFAAHPAMRFTSKFLGYAGCLYLIALGSYLLFHVYINILILTIYFSTLDYWRKKTSHVKS